MKLNMTQAADRLGITAKTWRNWRKRDDFPASMEENENGDPVIDLSELIRCWPERLQSDEQGAPKKGEKGRTQTPADAELAAQLEIKQARLEMLQEASEDHKEQIAFLKEQVKALTEQESIRLKQIEDRRKKDETQRASENAQRQKEREAAAKFRKRSEELERKLKAYQSMGLWERLLGWPRRDDRAAG